MSQILKALSRFKLITFDVTDTILQFNISPGLKYAEVGAIYGVKADPVVLAQNFKLSYIKMSEQHPNYGLYSGIGWYKWWNLVVTDTFKASSDISEQKILNEIADTLIDIYQHPDVWSYTEGSQVFLQELHNSHMCLGVISNFDERLPELLNVLRLKSYFNFVLTSYDAHCEKPDPKIFQLALQMSNVKDIQPEEALHIGNTPHLDYIGAIRSGWHSILITDQRKHINPKINKRHVYKTIADFRKDLEINSVSW